MSTFKSGSTLVLLAASMSAALAASGAASTAALGSPRTADTVHPHGTVVVALPVQSFPNWYFPVYSAPDFTSTNEQIDALMYKPLLDVTKNNTIDYRRSLVNRITVNKGDTVFTLHMNPTYHWSNGTPVSAQDVVFTWNIIKAASADNPHLPFTYGGAGTGGVPTDWKSVTAVNASTVQVTLTKGVNPDWFIHNGLSQINPVPEAIWNRYPHNMEQELKYINGLANSPLNAVYHVVDGPYMLQSYTPNQQWVFVPNPRYNGHQSSIAKLIFAYETSSASEFTALKTGAVSVGYIPMSLWTSRKALSGYNVTPGYQWGMTYLQLNFNSNAPGHINRLFDNLYVRQALDMGINQPAIIKQLYHGQGIEANGPVPSKPNTPFYDKALNRLTYPYNPVAGKALLERHGWKMTHGVMTKDGEKLAFSINYITGSTTATDLMEYLATSWAKEGIKVNLIPTPGSQFPLPNNKWDAIFTGLTSWVYSPDFYPTGGGLFKTGAALNFWGYSNPTMNRLVNLTYAPYTTQAQEQQRMDAYQMFASQQLPLLFLPYAASFYVSSTDLHGYRSTLNLISGLITPQYWSIR